MTFDCGMTFDEAVADVEEIALRVGRSSCDCPLFAFLDGSGLVVIHPSHDHPYPPGQADVFGNGEGVRVDVMEAPARSPLRGGTT